MCHSLLQARCPVSGQRAHTGRPGSCFSALSHSEPLETSEFGYLSETSTNKNTVTDPRQFLQLLVCEQLRALCLQIQAVFLKPHSLQLYSQHPKALSSCAAGTAQPAGSSKVLKYNASSSREHVPHNPLISARLKYASEAPIREGAGKPRFSSAVRQERGVVLGLALVIQAHL